MEVMEPVKFTIDIEAPLGGPAPELREHLQGSPTWRYRVLSLEAQRLESSVYHITLLIHPDDIHKETDLYELFAFRDRLLSLVSVSAMVPVRMRTTGGFHFALGNRQYEMISLGPTGGEYAPSPLLSLRPLLEGLSASENLAAVIYFIWQAINASDANEAIYRFINLELARIGSLLFIFADSPNDQNGSSSSIDTFATRLSAQALSYLCGVTRQHGLTRTYLYKSSVSQPEMQLCPKTLPQVLTQVENSQLCRE